MLRSLTAAIIVAAGTIPAQAQFFPYPEPYFAPRPPPRYGYDPYGYNPYARRAPQQIGNVCITSRGNCRVQWVPAGSGCRCMIPGFGPKRGNVIATRQRGGFDDDDE